MHLNPQGLPLPGAAVRGFFVSVRNPQGGLADGPCRGRTQDTDALTDKPARELAGGITGTEQNG